MSETSTFDFNAFIKESKETLLNPKAYFSTMKTSGGWAEPLIKAVIYGAVAGIIAFIWSIVGLSGLKAGMFGGAIGAMALVWSIVGAVIGLFIGAVILLIISSICKGSTDFEANGRVVAASMVIMPINALLAFTAAISSWLGLIISLAVSLYALYIMYHGLVESLKAKPETARIVMYILAVLLVLFMLLGMSTRNKMNKYLDNPELKEMLQDLEKQG
jgi:hypothetical protein